MAATFRSGDVRAMMGADVLAARTRRFENERNVARAAAPAPKKVMAWAGGTITSNKEDALARFLARKAAKGEAVDPALLERAIGGSAVHRAAVAMDAVKASRSAGDDGHAVDGDEKEEHTWRRPTPGSRELAPQHQRQQQRPMSKAAKKNAKRNARKTGEVNARVADEIYTSLFR